jgi:hypothetical protein
MQTQTTKAKSQIVAAAAAAMQADAEVFGD